MVEKLDCVVEGDEQCLSFFNEFVIYQWPQSITFERFMVQAGSDSTGVSTDMISVNSTVKLTYRNTATFFGVHVSSTPIALTYSQLNIGSGTVSHRYDLRFGNCSVPVFSEEVST